MDRYIKTVFILIIFAVNLVDRSFTGKTELNEPTIDIINVTKDVVLAIANAWKIVDQNITFSDIPLALVDKIESNLFKKIKKISANLEIQEDATGRTILDTVVQCVPKRLFAEALYVKRTDANYHRFKNQTEIDRWTWEDFDKYIDFNNPSNFAQTLNDPKLLLNYVAVNKMCNLHLSPQQILYNIYNAVVLTELKDYTMTQFSYMFLRLYGKGSFKKEAQLVKQIFEIKTNCTITKVREAMKKASREIWNNDPNKHEEEKTYVEVTRLLEGYVQNVVNLNSGGSCINSCSSYSYTHLHTCSSSTSKICEEQNRCRGTITNCQFFGSDLSICKANTNSNRRYENINYKKNNVWKTLGRGQTCKNKDTINVSSWTKWLFWKCSYCVCLCDQASLNSDRFINMRPVIANTNNNYVVTGLRFVKKNRIIHLQIQEGKLLPGGKIDIKSVHWVPPEDYKITDRKIYNGQDYHTLSYTKRSIGLDDLEADEGSILTGVRFKMLGMHLIFEIYVTKFNFDTGKLESNTGDWQDYTGERTEIKLNHPDIPTRCLSPSKPNRQPHQYIKFVNSDTLKDAAQTTVPFLDAQKLESLQPVPLSGAGIFHKGSNNFGGFITPKIITYDFSRHLNVAFSDD